MYNSSRLIGLRIDGLRGGGKFRSITGLCLFFRFGMSLFRNDDVLDVVIRQIDALSLLANH